MNENFYPHCGKDPVNKVIFLAYMTRKLLLRIMDPEKGH